jgi:sterol desaturase/sphingolipid hydroxylase (fatty acid hydroxylase superfamily)
MRSSPAIIGYVCYDMIHYATHHLPMRGRLMKALKRQHMQHHFQNPDERYGVSTPIWDVAFGTWPRREAAAVSPQVARGGTGRRGR